MHSHWRWAALLVCSTLLAGDTNTNWPVYGGDPGGSKYSPLKQIHRGNVSRLRVAWTFRTGEPTTHLPNSGKGPAFEATPIVIDGVMYIGTPYGHAYALDAATGKEKWSYDVHIDRTGDYGDFANRGVTYWADPQAKRSAPCARRIFFASIDARLTALDAATGTPCSDFGEKGQLNLESGLKRGPEYKGELEETSPPAVINGLVVVGSAIADNNRARSVSGEVRAFDARTGALKWTWHPIDTTNTGAGNAWSIISTDPQRNLVFVPTGSASPDYFGGLRPGDDRDANSVVALDAATGKRVWGFQTVHHDIWDYDVANQPTLFTLKRNGQSIPAVAFGSKTGHLFLLDRTNGQPLFDIEERKAPASDVPGEQASPTQPVPLAPKAWTRQSLTPEEAFGVNEADKTWCRDQISALRNEGIFTPPSLKGSLIIPGNIGGMQWGGLAWDRDHNTLIVPVNNLAAVIKLIPAADFKQAKATNRIGAEITRQKGAPYAMSRILLRAPSGVPCTPPPWGTLAAVDAATGALKWQVPVGSFPGMPADAGPKFGSILLGGPIATAGGLVFLGATLDPYLKAFDVETGKLLWSGELPASSRAVPMTYETGGKQYVAVAAGGHESSLGKLDNTIVVFSLP